MRYAHSAYKGALTAKALMDNLQLVTLAMTIILYMDSNALVMIQLIHARGHYIIMQIRNRAPNVLWHIVPNAKAPRIVLFVI
jgi:hypothetical protein